MDYSGQILDGRYRILGLLGKGGMGSVYLGQHVVIGKKVAVKFLHAELAINEDIVKRFYREAQAAAAIAHGNIIDVMDVGVSPSNEPYMVMEYLEGESLSSMLERTGPIDLPAALAVLEPALLALAAAHDKGIIHRDLKPENIFISHAQDEPPKVKLIDFGISKFIHQAGTSRLTQTGTLLGTPAYMPPEQIRGDRDLDHRADIYAMGVILYEMLTGKMPFLGEHYNALLINVLTEHPVPPKEAYADFPEEVEPLLMRLLSKDPAGRPGSARVLLEEIKELASYEKRQEHLSRYASGITKKSYASGDLGGKVASAGSGKGAAEILAEMSAKPTPANWAGTLAPSRRWMGVLVAAAVVAMAVALKLLWSNADSPKATMVPLTPAAPARDAAPPTLARTSPDPVPAQSVHSKSVEIKLLELPPGATIFFDNAPIDRNPFTVTRSEKEAPLKVTAPGHVDYVKFVAPNGDMEINTRLVPLPKESAPPADSVAEKPERPRTPKREKQTASEHPSTKHEQPPAEPKPEPKSKVEAPEEQPSDKIVNIGGGIKGKKAFGD